MTQLKLVVALLLCCVDVGFCINTGSNLLSTARQYDGRDYSDIGEPPNLYYSGDKKGDFYLYHYYWGSSSWNGEDSWAGAFDCSGLVSYAANLRRHYSASELKSVLGSSKTWDNASVGDVISFEDINHVSIFVNRIWNDDIDDYEITVFHATSYNSVSSVLQETYRQSYYTVTHTAHPHEFISDSIIPQISTKIIEDDINLENYEVYNHSISIDYGATDNITEYRGPFIKANYLDLKKFDEDGNYELHIIAEDWARNINDTTVNFTIDRTPPTITYLNLQETPHFTCKDNDNCGAPEDPKHILWTPSKFTIEDISGVTALNIYKGNFGELYYSETLEDIENINRTFTFIEGSTYTMVATDTLEQSTTMYFIVDAFRPYLKKAEIIRDFDDDTKYSKEWTLNGTILTYLEPKIEDVLGNYNYTIKFEFSEPVVNPTLSSIDTLSNFTLSSDEPVGNQKNFTAELIVEDNPPIEGDEYIMTVKAADLTGNNLLALNQDQTTINPVTQLTRNAEGTMQGTGGSDTSVVFTIDREPPTIKLNDITDLYGIQTQIVFIQKTRFPMEVYDELTGTIQVAILNNEGVHVEGQVFPEPQNNFQDTFNLGYGQYTAMAMDEAENITSVPFRIVELTLKVSTSASIADVSRYAFSADINIKATSNSGLSTITLQDSDFELLNLEPVAGINAFVDFNISGSIADYYDGEGDVALFL
ncbi:C40 family peptidase [bacterium]|nr:C40 family peptidase [bacterium]